MANYVENLDKGVANWLNPFERKGCFPLDRSSIFSSYQDALLYAKGDGTDSRKLGGTSYVGQIITVYENGKVDVYKIEENRNLSTIGGSTENGGVNNEVIQDLLNRIGRLESEVSSLKTLIENNSNIELPSGTVLTNENIGDYAVTSIKSSSSDLTFNDKDWDSTTEYKGDVTITLSNISNISFGDSTEINTIVE